MGKENREKPKEELELKYPKLQSELNGKGWGEKRDEEKGKADSCPKMAGVGEACRRNGPLDNDESFSRSFTVKTRPPPTRSRATFALNRI